jgi:outer membrane murein-binding lipoprotein Lpp
MSGAVMTSVVALVGAVLAALSGAYATNQARKARVATVDKDIFDAMRQDFLAAKAEIRQLEREVDEQRHRRRELEDVVHRIARALHHHGITIPDDVASLLRPPPGTGPGP